MLKRGTKKLLKSFKKSQNQSKKLKHWVISSNRCNYFSSQDKDTSQLSKKRITAVDPLNETVYNINSNNRTPGFATPEGTLKYSQRNPKVPKSNFKSPNLNSGEILNLSTLGYGSYLGDPSNEHDILIRDAILKSVSSGGVNVIDTAINYRYMKSERTIGVALKDLETDFGIGREEIFVCSKGGYIAVKK